MSEPGAEEFKSRDAKSYDTVVDHFDHFTVRFTRPIAARMVELAQIRRSDQVLDVGAGTGVVALEAAPRLGDAGCVTAIDLSEKMLKAAREKAEERGLAARVRTQVEDAEKLTFAERTFDRVLSLYALFHFPHPEIALAEMFRVLRPGGRAVVAVGSSPPFRSRQGLVYLLRRLPFIVQARRGKWLAAPAFLDGLVEQLLPPAKADEESELARHRAHGASAASLPAMFERAGFVDVATTSEAGLGVLSSAEEFWELQRTFSSKSRKRMEEAAPDQVDRLKRAFLDRARAVQQSGGKLTYPYAAYIITARRA